MKKLKAWMTEHKKFSVIALCLLLMFTCGSAMSAINVSHHRAETAKEQNAYSQRGKKGCKARI